MKTVHNRFASGITIAITLRISLTRKSATKRSHVLPYYRVDICEFVSESVALPEKYSPKLL